MKKLWFLNIFLLAALVLLGISYAVWPERFNISGIVDTSKKDLYFDVARTTPGTGNLGIKDRGFENKREPGKDTGSTTVELADYDIGDNEVAGGAVYKAHYYNYPSLKIRNNGTIPVKGKEATVSNPNSELLKADRTDNSGATMLPGRNNKVNTREVDWGIKDWTAYDKNFENTNKGMGSTTVKLADSSGDGDNDTVVVDVNNSCPGYYSYISLTVKNEGTIPIKMQKMAVNNPTPEAIEVIGINDSDTIIFPGKASTLAMCFYILEGAEQNSSYTFSVTSLAMQWNY